MKIGYQGIPGSYSDAALEHYVQLDQSDERLLDEPIEKLGYNNFKTLISDLVHHKSDAAILPVENSTTGLITRTIDLLRYQPVVASHEIYQSIQHSLLGVVGSRLDQITKVYSHPEALAQCASFFEQHPDILPLPCSDTAQAAVLVKTQNDKTIAALASSRAGKLYGLKTLQTSVQTEEQNITRFFFVTSVDTQKMNFAQLVKQWRVTYPDRTRWMLYVETIHKPGALAKILNTIELFDCNMEGLDARPIKDKPFLYGFIIEIDVSNLLLETETFWKTLAYTSDYLQLLACFKPTDILMDHL